MLLFLLAFDFDARALDAINALISTHRPAAAHKLALADVVAWWRFELAAMARALRTSADRARDELGIELRSFYRTSPPAADRWVHRARYEVCFFGVFFSLFFAEARAAVVRRACLSRRLDPVTR